jgi:hypothetical protein
LIGAAVMVSMVPLWGALVYVGLFPQPEDFRVQVITRQAGEKEWPFAVDMGTLTCVFSFGFKVVIFIPYAVTEPDDELLASAETNPDVLIVTTDPLQLMTQWEQEKLYAPGMRIEEKIQRLGPYVTLGKRLCDQPKGAIVGPGEL